VSLQPLNQVEKRLGKKEISPDEQTKIELSSKSGARIKTIPRKIKIQLFESNSIF